ncbi:MAG: hypothetical protein HYY46_15470 [Deltaproteobacteria bacterium]|nr:hypothetical protein [Deltaproteobacteria bacterium]
MSDERPLIEVAGVTHEDPVGARRLNGWLGGLGFGTRSMPAFVAVEYDSSHLPQIVAQRPSFRKLVEREWSFLLREDHAELERSLGYEGDAHTEIFPDSETLWLDEGRQGVQKAVTEFAKQRLDVLRHSAESISQDCDRFLLRLSRQVCEEAKTNRLPTADERDERFASLVIARTRRQSWRRAVAIVGASHARHDVEGSFVRLVEAGGIRCRITMLDACNG